MYLNNIILVFLNVLYIIIFLSYFLAKKKSYLYLILDKKLSSLLIVSLIGVLIAFVQGVSEGIIPSLESKVDFMRISNFLLLFIIPIVLSNIAFFKSPQFRNIFHKGAFIYIVLVAVSLFTKGSNNSAFAGNFFGATTVSMTIISTLTFLGLLHYYLYKKRVGLLIALIGYIVCLASLAKWNLIVILVVPLLFYFVLKSKKIGNNRNRTITLIFLALMLTGLAVKREIVFAKFANINNFENFDDYLSTRVYRSQVYDSKIESGVAINIGDKGIKDGARLLLWKDLMTRTLQNPIAGLGLGARAFDNKGQNVEDHNLLVFLLSRFGLIIGSIFIYLLIKVFIKFSFILIDKKYPLVKYIYSGLIINFLFQSSVGNIWGQLPVILILGIVLHFFADPNYIFGKFKSNAPNEK